MGQTGFPPGTLRNPSPPTYPRGRSIYKRATATLVRDSEVIARRAGRRDNVTRPTDGRAPNILEGAVGRDAVRRSLRSWPKVPICLTREVGAAGGPCRPLPVSRTRGLVSGPERFRTRRNRNACEEGGAAQTTPLCWERSNRPRSHHPARGRSGTHSGSRSMQIDTSFFGPGARPREGRAAVQPCRPSRSAGAAPAALSAGRPQHQGFRSRRDRNAYKEGAAPRAALANAGLFKPATAVTSAAH